MHLKSGWASVCALLGLAVAARAFGGNPPPSPADYMMNRTGESVCKSSDPKAIDACAALQGTVDSSILDQWSTTDFGPYKPGNPCVASQVWQAHSCAFRRSNDATEKFWEPRNNVDTVENRIFEKLREKDPAAVKALRDSLKGKLDDLTTIPYYAVIKGEIKSNNTNWYSHAEQAWRDRIALFQDSCAKAGIECTDDVRTMRQFADQVIVAGSRAGNALAAQRAVENKYPEIFDVAGLPLIIEVNAKGKEPAKKPEAPSRNSLRSDFPRADYDYSRDHFMWQCLQRGVNYTQGFRNVGESAICERLAGDTLTSALDDVNFLMAGTSAEAYLELLRLEAITRAAKSYRALTGDSLRARHFDGGCKPFGDVIDGIAREPMPETSLFKDPKYREKLKRESKRFARLAGYIPKLGQSDYKRDWPCKYDSGAYGGDACFMHHWEPKDKPAHCVEIEKHYVTMNPKRIVSLLDSEWLDPAKPNRECIAPMHAEYEAAGLIEKKLERIAEQFPFFGTERGSGPLWKSVPSWLKLMGNAKTDADFDFALLAAQESIHADYVKTLDFFCSADSETDGWSKLVGMSALTGPVLQAFPEFKDLQYCFEDAARWKQQSSLSSALNIACLLGSIGPQVVIVGPACAGILLGTGIHDYLVAKDEVNWAAACEAAHSGQKEWDNRICTSEEYEAAVAEYDGAVTGLVLSSVFAVGEGASLAVKGLRAAGAVLRPDELRAATKFMKNIRDAREAKAFTQGMEELAEIRRAGNAGGRDVVSVIKIAETAQVENATREVFEEASAEAKQWRGRAAEFKGPNPTMHPPKPGELKTALAEFATPEAAAKASAASEKAILDEVTAENRATLVEMSQARKQVPGEVLGPSCTRAYCGSARDDFFYRMQDKLKNSPGGKAVKVHLYQARDAFGGGRHAFAVVEFPSGRKYLFDTTFRQFFNPDEVEILAGEARPGQSAAVGLRMRTIPGGSEMADQLLRDGYIPLTDEAADAYGQSMRAGLSVTDSAPPRTKITVSDYLDPAKQEKFPDWDQHEWDEVEAERKGGGKDVAIRAGGPQPKVSPAYFQKNIDLAKLEEADETARAELSSLGVTTGGRAESYFDATLRMENPGAETVAALKGRTALYEIPVEGLPKPRKAGPQAIALTHPDLPKYLEKLKANGYKLVVDSSLPLQETTGAYKWAARKVLAIKPQTTWRVFLHEYQHFEFELFLKQFGKYENLAQIPDDVAQLIKVSDPNAYRAIELAKSGLPEIAADETLAVEAELAALKDAGYKRWGGLAISRRDYALYHQIDGLKQIPRAQRTAAQQALLRRAMLERYLLTHSNTRALYIVMGAAAVGGAGTLAVREIFLNTDDGKVRVVKTDGSAVEIDPVSEFAKNLPPDFSDKYEDLPQDPPQGAKQ
jgi:hypothetical protein